MLLEEQREHPGTELQMRQDVLVLERVVSLPQAAHTLSLEHSKQFSMSQTRQASPLELTCKPFEHSEQ